MALTLVILAAGKGSRFGGDKPLAAVGPNGESLFEYSVHDAVLAGFTRVIFVVSACQETSEFTNRLAHYGNRLTVEFVVQDLAAGVNPDSVAATTRDKPWGTGQAVLVCRSLIDTPFIVINADDYYGRSNFKQIGSYLLAHANNPHVAALSGYQLRNTLSQSGGVNRGVCTVGTDGYLQSIQEVKNIAFDGKTLSCDKDDNGDIEISLDSIVSMSCWGFHPAIFAVFESAFEQFLSSSDLVNDEFYILYV